MTQVDATAPAVPRSREIFTNRTLNLRAIRAVGFDMDYTLVHYHVEEWEQRAYESARKRLIQDGWPLHGFRFDPGCVSLGLVLDLELGNIVKASRFGYVTRATHGTRRLSFEAQRAAYARVLVDLEEPRWVFLNTLFALSEAALYAQLVDLLDAGKLPAGLGYADLYRRLRAAHDHVHTEGALKQDIAADPERYVDRDPELALTLLDLKAAGKQLLVVTNSEWWFTRAMLSYALDRDLPSGQTWRDLFDLVIVDARKPTFFATESPIYEIVDEAGLLRPYSGEFRLGGAYLGGSAAFVERNLGLIGEQILYVGDHIAADVRASKDLLRWRTALILRDLEPELDEQDQFAPRQAELSDLMQRKERLEHEAAWVRLQQQRQREAYGPQPTESSGKLKQRAQALRTELEQLDAQVAPLAREAGELRHERWGPLMTAGNDKSHLARQIERSADIYMSRVSNLLHHTPFAYLRAPGGSMPHDP